MIKRVHHIGIAVNSLKESVPVFEKMLGVKAHVQVAPDKTVKEASFKIGDGVEIGLIEPASPDSAVAKFLEKHGEGLHHIALETDNINAELKNMEKKGFQLIDKEGREGLAGKIGFIHPKSANGVLVELVQPREKE
jgi:methylmalonyl-CoA/ethylmalonyl-CoA epimerase